MAMLHLNMYLAIICVTILADNSAFCWLQPNTTAEAEAVEWTCFQAPHLQHVSQQHSFRQQTECGNTVETARRTQLLLGTRRIRRQSSTWHSFHWQSVGSSHFSLKYTLACASALAAARSTRRAVEHSFSARRYCSV